MDKKVVEAESEGIDWGGRGAAEGEVSKKSKTLSKNVHTCLPYPLTDPVKCSLIKGDYLYFHYGCDGHDDRGWGCGYRTVQRFPGFVTTGFH